MAEEYLHNAGDWTPRFPIERWREDQRKRFLAEFRRLETKHERDRASAVEAAARRSEEQGF